MSSFRPYSKLEVESAYALLMFIDKNKTDSTTWHTDPMDNIFLRTEVCKETIDFLSKNYHCLGLNVEDFAIRIEHYHYVVSKNELEYLNADTLKQKIRIFCEANNIYKINFEAL